MATYRLLILMFLVTHNLPANPWKKLLAQVSGLSKVEKSIVRNWCNLKFSKHKMPETQYNQIVKEYDEQTRSTEMFAITGDQFQKLPVAKVMNGIEGFSKHRMFHNYSLFKIFDKLKDK